MEGRKAQQVHQCVVSGVDQKKLGSGQKEKSWLRLLLKAMKDDFPVGRDGNLKSL